MTAPDVVQKRNEWLENIDSYDADTLVFLDESGVNIDMTRRYGRAVGKTRAVDKTPESTPTNTTILSSVRLNGDTAYTTYSGGTTGDVFVGYLENILVPTLHKGDIVIMDNLRSHHVKKWLRFWQKRKSNYFISHLTVPILILSRKCGLRLNKDFPICRTIVNRQECC